MRILTALVAALALPVALATEAAAQTVTLSASPGSLAEGAGATDIEVTASVSPMQSSATTVTLSLAGTARSSDYQVSALPSVTIPANTASASATIVLTPVDDNFWEMAESIEVNGSAGSLTVNGASVTLSDNETQPTLQWTFDGTGSIAEGESKDRTGTLRLHGGAAFEDDVTIATALEVVSGDATAGVDYTVTPSLPLASTLTAGSRSLTITWTIAATDDAIEEGRESVRMRSTLTHLGTAFDAGQEALATISPSDLKPAWAVNLHPTHVYGGDMVSVTATVELRGGTTTRDFEVTVQAQRSADRTWFGTQTITVEAGAATASTTFNVTPPAVETTTTYPLTASASPTDELRRASPSHVTSMHAWHKNRPELDSFVIGGRGVHNRIAQVGANFTYRATFDRPFTLVSGQLTLQLDSGSVTVACSQEFTGTSVICQHNVANGQYDFDEQVQVAAGGLAMTWSDDRDPQNTWPNPTVPVSATTLDLTVPIYGGRRGIDLSVSPQSIQEGSGPTMLTVTALNATGLAWPNAVSVPFVFTDVGTTPSDYVVTGQQTITIPAGSLEGRATVMFTPVDDFVKESRIEVVQIAGDPSMPATFARAADLNVIDAPSIALSVAPASVAEDGGAQQVVVTAALGDPSDSVRPRPIPVALALAGTASAGDYAVTGNQQVTIPANMRSATTTLTLTPVDDNLLEGSETIVVSGSTPGLTVDATTLTLTDDDMTPQVILAVDDALVGEDETSPSVVTVTASLDPSVLVDGAVEVTLSLGGTATEGISGDYTASWSPVSREIVIPAGSRTGSAAVELTLTPQQDTRAEGDETIVVEGTATNDLTVTVATITLQDDDTAGLVIRPSPLAVNEGDDASYTVRLATQPTAEVRVAITGDSSTDLALDTRSLTFTTTNWSAAQTVTVTADEDTDAQNDRATLVHAASGGDYSGETAELVVTTIDDEELSLDITGVPGKISSRTAFTATFTFSEAVTDFVIADVTVTGGTTGALSGSGTTYTLAVTPDGSADVVVEVPANSATLGDGSTGPPAAVSETAVWDADAPTVEITGVPEKISSMTAFTATFTFSEEVTEFVTGDVTVSGGTTDTFTPVSATVYTLDVTPSGSADVVVTVTANSATDGLNTGPTSAVSATATWDADAPTVEISGVPEQINSMDQFTATFTFSEDVTDFLTGDVTVTGGRKGAFTAVSETEYTLAVTPSGSADVVVTVTAHSATDGLNTGPASAVSATATWDADAPTVEITGVPEKINSTDQFTATFTFSEEVTEFVTGDVTVSGGTKSTFTTVSGTTYTLDVTPSGSADVVVTVTADSATDGLNTGPATAVSATATWDAAAPTVAITGVPDKINSTAALNVTFTFSENVTGFETGDVTVSGGTKGTFAAVNGTTYTLAVTPTNGSNVTVEVTAHSATDGANTGPASAVSATATWDAAPPTVTITGVPEKINSTAQFTATFTFSEEVTQFVTGDVTVSGGNKGTFTAASATTYTLAVTPTNGSNVTVEVTAHSATDGVNTGPATAVSATATWDAAAPTVAITGVPTKINSTAQFTATFTFSEAVTGFETGDVTVSGGTTGAFSGSGTTYTLAITPTNGSNVTVEVTAHSATDGANTGPATAVSATATWDAAAPTVAITGVPTKINSTAQFTATFTFSEEVTQFVTGDVTVSGGNKGTFTAASATTYTLAITPTNGSNVTVEVTAHSATDGVNTGPASAVSATATWDAAAPTVAIAGVPDKINSTAQFTATFAFSETVTGFETGDVTVSGGTKGAFSGSGTTYTLVVMPDGSTNVVVTVAENSATDGLNMGPSPAVSETATWDATAPTVDITGVPTRINSTTALNVTFTFSEDVTGFETGDVTVSGGNKGAFAGSGNEYTLVVTPTNGSNVTVEVADNSATDGGGNTGPTSPVSATATWDATGPTVDITGVPARINSIAQFTATFTFSETVTQFETGDVTVSGGNKGTFSGSGNEYTLAITPSGSADVVVTVTAGSATDGLNAGPATAVTETAVWDADAPTVAIGGVPAKINSNTALNVTFTFSEAVMEFVTGDVTVSGGTKGTFAGSGSSYTLAVTPSGSADVVVTVADNSATDGVNTGPATAVSETAVWDADAPAVEITGVPARINSITALNVTFTFTEAVTGFVTGDVTVSGGNKGAFTPVSATVYTLAVTPLGSADVVVTVAANSATDGGTNTGPASDESATATWDATAPTVDITGVPAKINSTAALNVTFTFSEAVTGFAIGDVTVTGGSSGALSGSGATYTLAVTPTSGSNVTVEVADNSVTDGLNSGPASAVSKTAVWDAAAPTVAISGVPAKIDSNAQFTATFTFSEAVTGFDTADVTVTGGSKSGFSGSGSTYTLAVTPSGSTNVVVTVAAGSATDGVNTGPATAESATAIWDAAAPTVAISGVPAKINSITALNVTFTFSESVTGFAIGDVTVTGGSAGALSGSGATYTLAVTPTSGSSVTVEVTAHSATDGLNTGPASAVSKTAVWDAAAPTVEIGGVPPKINSITALNVTFTFSESVTEFVIGDVTVSGGTKGTFSGSGATYALEVTPSGSADVVVEVAARSATDGLNTGPASAVSKTAVWDAASPAVEITGVPGRINVPTAFTATFTFSKDVTEFVTGDVTVSGGTKGAFTPVSATTYTLAVTPAGSADVVVTVTDNSATDGLNTGPASAVSARAVWDGDAPTVEIGGVPAKINSTTALNVTFTFSETVMEFVTGDVTVTGGSKETFSGSGSTYTLAVTPTSGSNLTVEVADNSATDGLNTGPASAVSARAVWDADAPTVEIDGVPAKINSTTALNVTFTFSEDVTEFETGDVTVSGGTKGTFSGSGATYRLEVMPAGSADVVVTVTANSATDGLNTGPASAVSATAVWDAASPAVEITGVPGRINATTAFTATFTFSKDVTEFVTSDVTVSGGRKGAFAAVSATTYTLEVTPAGSANVVVTVTAGSATDGLNTGPASAVSATAVWDPAAPTVAITEVPATINSTTAFTATFTFSEAVTGFVTSDVTVTGGTKGTFTAVSGTAYTLEVTPSGSADVVVTVAAESATDGLNTGPASAVSATAVWNAAVPTVAITGVPATINSTTAFTATFTFSEAVTGFDTGDVTVSGGSKGTFTAVSGTTYTLEVTPAGSVDVTVAVTVNSANGAFNTGPAATVSATAVWERAGPTVAITSVPATINSTTAFTATFTFSEAVTGFDTSDVTVSGGTKGTFSGSGTTYTLEVTPAGSVDVVVTVTANSAAGAFNTGPASAVSATAVWEKAGPTVVHLTVGDASAPEGQALTFTVTLDQAVSGGLTVTPAFSDGTATRGVDYTANTAALAFAGTAGETLTFTVATVDDTLVEGNETFTVGMTVSGAVTATVVGTGTIIDNGGPLPAVRPEVSLTAAPNAHVPEGDPVEVTLRLTSALGVDVTIPVTLTPATAEPEDFSRNWDSITISAGAHIGTELITTAQDDDQDDETFTVAIGALPQEVEMGTPSSSRITIVDDDVPPPNFPPTVTAACDPCRVPRGGQVRLTATASDPDGDPLTFAWSAPAGRFDGPTDGATARWTAPDKLGPVTIRVEVADGFGGFAMAEVTVNVVNRMPVFEESVHRFNLPENRAGRPRPIELGTMTATDPDGDTLTYEQATGDRTRFAVRASGGIVTYIGPGEDFEVEPSRYLFAVRVEDAHGAVAVARVIVTVTDMNEQPVAHDDAAETAEDQAVTVDVLANDSDPDGDELRVESVSAPAHGTTRITSGGRVTYTPQANYHGADRFTYVVTDPDGETAAATVAVTVRSVNDAPSAAGVIPDQVLEEGDGPVTLDLTPYFADVDDNALSYGAVSSDQSAVTVAVAGATLTLVPVVTGTAMVTVTATDPDGLTATQTFGVSVGDAPVRAVLTDALAALGRAHLSSARITIGQRLEYDSGATRLMVGGQQLTPEAWDQMGAGGLEQSHHLSVRAATLLRRRSPQDMSGTSADPRFQQGGLMGGGFGAGGTDWGQMLQSTDVLLSFGGQGTEETPGTGVGRWRIWGQGDWQSFQWGGGGATGYEGDLTTGYLGVDVQLRKHVLAGVAVSRSDSGGDWRRGFSDGRLGTELTVLHPYVRIGGRNTALWALAGVGRGTAETVRALTGQRGESPLDLRLGLVEGRHRLGRIAGGVQLALRGEASWAQLRTGDGEQTLDALEAAVRRVRTGVEATLPLGGPGGLRFAPFGAVSTRHDGGAGQTGVGLETAAGVRVSGGRLRVEAQGRKLLLHTATGYEEHGFSVTAMVGGGQYEPGLTASVRPHWGAPGYGAESLWQDRIQSYATGAGRNDAGVDARLGYGWQLPGGRLLTPLVGYGQMGESRRMQVGARLGVLGRFNGDLSAPVEVEFIGERYLRRDGADHRVGLFGIVNLGSRNRPNSRRPNTRDAEPDAP